jgi:hypothetical protein
MDNKLVVCDCVKDIDTIDIFDTVFINTCRYKIKYSRPEGHPVALACVSSTGLIPKPFSSGCMLNTQSGYIYTAVGI